MQNKIIQSHSYTFIGNLFLRPPLGMSPYCSKQLGAGKVGQESKITDRTKSGVKCFSICAVHKLKSTVFQRNVQSVTFIIRRDSKTLSAKGISFSVPLIWPNEVVYTHIYCGYAVHNYSYVATECTFLLLIVMWKTIVVYLNSRFHIWKYLKRMKRFGNGSSNEIIWISVSIFDYNWNY